VRAVLVHEIDRDRVRAVVGEGVLHTSRWPGRLLAMTVELVPSPQWMM
jgi:hypothetical protein